MTNDYGRRGGEAGVRAFGNLRTFGADICQASVIAVTALTGEHNAHDTKKHTEIIVCLGRMSLGV